MAEQPQVKTSPREWRPNIFPVFHIVVAAGLAIVASFAVTPEPAHAQFICEDNLSGTSGGAAAGGINSTACGSSAGAFGDNSLAVGHGAESLANNSTAIGAGAFAGGISGSTATGQGAIATGTWSSAFGDGAQAAAFRATAIGQNANAAFTNSAAFGQGATATRANQQAFGTASNTYTMAGITSQASKAAQSGPTEIVTTDADGNLATSSTADLGLASTGDINAINARIDRNSKRIGENTEGIAMAMAMAGTFLPQPGETFRISGNWGTFEGANALSFNGAYALGKRTYITAGFGAGLEEDTFGGRAGLSFGW